jgi:hypothetical protein
LRARGIANFEDQNNVLESFIVIINYELLLLMHIITLIYSQYNYYIYNKGFFEESDKEESVAVTWAATVSCLKRIL